MASDQEIVKGVENLLRQSDPTAVTSLNGVVQQLEAKLGQDLSHKAGFIRDQISLLLRAHPTPTLSQNPNPNPQKDHFVFQQQQQQQNPQLFPHATPQFASHFAFQQHHPQFGPQDLNFRQPQPQPHPLSASHFQSQTPPQGVKPELLPQNVAPLAAPQMSKESVPVAAKRKGGPGGLNKVCSVSPALQVIVGEPALPRTEIVKQLWAYIRKNSLQDPSNKRKIICDDALRVVFETDCTDMFKMNKLLAKHITPLQPSKESGSAKRLKVEAECATVTNQPSASPVMISEALAKFFGSEGREMLSAEAEKRVWEYIKVNHLEDPSNPMVVLCDDKLHELLGCDSISVVGIREMLLRHHLFRNS